MRDMIFLRDCVRSAVRLDVSTAIAGFPRSPAALEAAVSAYFIGQSAGRRRKLPVSQDNSLHFTSVMVEFAKNSRLQKIPIEI